MTNVYMLLWLCCGIKHQADYEIRETSQRLGQTNPLWQGPLRVTRNLEKKKHISLTPLKNTFKKLSNTPQKKVLVATLLIRLFSSNNSNEMVLKIKNFGQNLNSK